MNKNHQWLAQQIPSWVSANTITRQQADKLLSLYPVRDSINLGRLLLTAVGAIMIGLGVILLFAYNWDDMPKYAKLSVIFGSLITAHSLGLWFMTRNKLLSEGMFVLGTMLMGSAIFLVGQIYHLDTHYPDAFLLWSAGALLLAWALPSLPQAFMAIILVSIWHVTEVVDFNFSNQYALLLILVAVFPLVWRLHSPILARFASATLLAGLALSILAEDASLIVITLIMTSSALISLKQIVCQYGNDEQKNIAIEIGKPALLVLIVTLFSLTFTNLIDNILLFEFTSQSSNTYFWSALFISQISFAWLLLKKQLKGIVMLSELTVLIALLPLLISFIPYRNTLPVIYEFIPLVFNLILLISSVWLMIEGARQANKRHMVTGSLMFSVLAMLRYTDLFESLVMRALVFLFVGITLFIIGNIYQRNKKEARS